MIKFKAATQDAPKSADKASAKPPKAIQPPVEDAADEAASALPFGKAPKKAAKKASFANKKKPAK